MKLRKLAASAVIGSLLAAAPAVAQSTVSAQSLSLATAPRAGASLKGENQIEGVGTGLLVIGAIVVGLAIWGIIELTKDDEPSSP